MKKNIIYFCREYNDIDHVVPIADELLTNGSVNSLCFFNYNLNKSFTDDYRISYLKRHSHFTYVDCYDTLHFANIILIKLLGPLKKIHSSFRIIRSRLINSIYKRTDFNNIVQNKTNLLFLFDHSFSSFIDNAYNFTVINDIPIGLLMHGLDPTENLLMSTQMLTINKLDTSWQKFNKADTFFVNNEHYKMRSLAHGVDTGIINIIGSARFSFKWSNVLENITPDIKLPSIDPTVIKVVIMLNKYKYNTWKEEIKRVIKTLLLIKGVFIIIKPHTRNMKFDGFNNDRIFIADQNCHSRKLFEWSDLTLVTLSSIFLDGLLLDKPVLFLRLATSNKLSCNHIMKNWNIDCRDDLIMWVNRFKEDIKTRTYTEKERLECLNYYVNDHDNQLLSRYSKSILELKKRGQ